MATVNLLRPRLPARGTVRLRRTLWAGGVLSALCLVSLVMYGWLLAQQARLGGLVTESSSRLAAERRSLARWQSLVAAEEALEGREAGLRRIPAATDRLARVARQVAAVAPPDVALGQLQVDATGGVILGGTAGSHTAVAALIEGLRGVPELSGVTFHSSHRTGESGLLRFQLAARISGYPQDDPEEGRSR